MIIGIVVSCILISIIPILIRVRPEYILRLSFKVNIRPTVLLLLSLGFAHIIIPLICGLMIKGKNSHNIPPIAVLSMYSGLGVVVLMISYGLNEENSPGTIYGKYDIIYDRQHFDELRNKILNDRFIDKDMVDEIKKYIHKYLIEKHYIGPYNNHEVNIFGVPIKFEPEDIAVLKIISSYYPAKTLLNIMIRSKIYRDDSECRKLMLDIINNPEYLNDQELMNLLSENTYVDGGHSVFYNSRRCIDLCMNESIMMSYTSKIDSKTFINNLTDEELFKLLLIKINFGERIDELFQYNMSERFDFENMILNVAKNGNHGINSNGYMQLVKTLASSHKYVLSQTDVIVENLNMLLKNEQQMVQFSNNNELITAFENNNSSIIAMFIRELNLI